MRAAIVSRVTGVAVGREARAVRVRLAGRAAILEFLPLSLLHPRPR